MGFSLRIRDLDGKETSINIPPRSSVEELKKAYSKHCGDPVENIKLVFRGKALKNNEGLDTIQKLVSNSVLIACVRVPSLSTSVGLQMPDSSKQANSQKDTEVMKIELEKLRLEDKAAARRHELERLKMHHEFELKKLEIELQK